MPTSKTSPRKLKKSPASASAARKKAKVEPRRASARKASPKARPAKAKSAPARKPKARPRGASPTAAPKQPPPPAPPPTPYVSAAYLKALADYEKAMNVLQKRDYPRAEELFQKLMEAHPGEKDLVDRARVYVNLCRKQQETSSSPQGFDDHYYQGVVLSNRGQHHEALQLFEKALRFKPDSEKVYYAMAAAHAQVHDRARALECLRKAVELDGSSRVHARQDPDFDLLRGEPEFEQLVGPADRTLAG